MVNFKIQVLNKLPWRSNTIMAFFRVSREKRNLYEMRGREEQVPFKSMFYHLSPASCTHCNFVVSPSPTSPTLRLCF